MMFPLNVKPPKSRIKERFCENIMHGTYDNNTCSDISSGSLNPARSIQCAYGTTLLINEGIDSKYKQDLEYYLGCQFDTV